MGCLVFIFTARINSKNRFRLYVSHKKGTYTNFRQRLAPIQIRYGIALTVSVNCLITSSGHGLTARSSNKITRNYGSCIVILISLRSTDFAKIYLFTVKSNILFARIDASLRSNIGNTLRGKRTVLTH